MQVAQAFSEFLTSASAELLKTMLDGKQECGAETVERVTKYGVLKECIGEISGHEREGIWREVI